MDTPADIRFIRRLTRDIHERGRTPDSVNKQYLATVRPMHNQFVEPSKYFADLIVPEGGENKVAVDLIRTKINSILKKLATNKIVERYSVIYEYCKQYYSWALNKKFKQSEDITKQQNFETSEEPPLKL